MTDSRYRPAPSPLEEAASINAQVWAAHTLPATGGEPGLDSGFWLLHPIKRGLVAGVLCGIYSRTTTFPAGFMFGAISSVYNMAFRMATRGQRENISSPESLAMTYIMAALVPWTASALTMRHAHKLSAKPLFHITTAAAVASAAVVEFLDPANKDMLFKKTPKSP